MKVSVCITIFNEKKKNVIKLLDALNNQTLKPEEIIVVDAKDYNNCSRSKGRNLAIKKARNETIAITDAGCTPHKDWLEKLTKPYTDVATANHSRSGIVVAGGYKMVARNSFEKAERIFLGVKSAEMNEDFLPSARSMAFTKSIWKRAGGFPEELEDTAEDTVFNLNLLKSGAKFIVSKNAIVDWYMPKTIFNFYFKIFNYARGDAQSGIWWHPVKKWQTHNLKVITIFLRYFLFISLFLYATPVGQTLLILYTLYAYKKAGPWGICLQFISDFAVMFGFIRGLSSSSTT